MESPIRLATVLRGLALRLQLNLAIMVHPLTTVT